MRGERRAQLGERLRAAELRVDLVVIGDVVAVRAAGRRGEVRRRVAGGDAQLRQVRNDVARGGQREPPWICSRYVLSGTNRGRCGVSRSSCHSAIGTRGDARRSEKVEDTPERNAHPVGPVVQLVVELVERLVEHEEPQQRVALRGSAGRNGASPAVSK